MRIEKLVYFFSNHSKNNFYHLKNMNILSYDHISTIISHIKTLKDYINFTLICKSLYDYSQKKHIYKQNMKRFIKLQFSKEIYFEIDNRKHYEYIFTMKSTKINFRMVYRCFDKRQAFEISQAVKAKKDYDENGYVEIKNGYVYFYTNNDFSVEGRVIIKCEVCVDAFIDFYNSFEV